ncbi:MAG: alpha/beta fold hydrolase [Pseudomonadota bacterium]
MRKLGKYLLFVLAALGLFALAGPTEEADTQITFKTDAIGDDLDGYLAAQEATFTDIIPGAEKRIIWADPSSKRKTEFAIVYVHGFSATSEEIRPVPDDVARNLGANLHFTRLAGHGRGADPMAQASVNKWMNNLAEALAIGRRLGDKVVVISTSTGGTLMTLAATKPALMRNVVGSVMISPNFAVQAAGADILLYPWARQLVPRVFGEYREWEPKNDEQRKWWSTRYPNVALLPMQAAVNAAGNVAYEELDLPTLFIFHPEDGVVKSAVTEQVAARWGQNSGAKASVQRVEQSDDTSKHVVAGAILDPDNTEPVTTYILNWIKTL